MFLINIDKYKLYRMPEITVTLFLTLLKRPYCVGFLSHKGAFLAYRDPYAWFLFT